MKPSEDWLRAINEKFRSEDVPPKARPILAILEYSKQFNCSWISPSDIDKTIETWFDENTKPGSHKIGSLYKGTFYFDSCFWQIDIPIGIGCYPVKAFDSLTLMPDNLKKEIQAKPQILREFIAVWLNCVDYAYGYNDILQLNTFNELATSFIKSAHKELQAKVSLLLEESPQAKAIETSRMAVEMYLKAILIIKNGWNDETQVRKIGHDLDKAVEQCIKLANNQHLEILKDKLNFFPPISERYKAKEWKTSELWFGYSIAQYIATTFTRMFSDRDNRNKIFSGNL
ncbi:hypothetical protein [Nodularia chucula]|uniref:hypothetical protein n=1 Tax=Nodularia chucula TaxID=3093667 RepID=UPI0039C5FFE2